MEMVTTANTSAAQTVVERGIPKTPVAPLVIPSQLSKTTKRMTRTPIVAIAIARLPHAGQREPDEGRDDGADHAGDEHSGNEPTPCARGGSPEATA